MAVDRRRIYHKRDRLKQLRAFCHVARFASIAQTAEHLAVGRSVVSLHVRELEYELQAVLFERHGPRVALTAAGKQLHRLVLPLVEAMDHLSGISAGGLDATLSGEVRVVAETCAAAVVLPPAVERSRDRYPDVRLRVRTGSVHEGLKLLSSREVDLVIGEEEPNTESFACHYLFSSDFVLITPEDHPLAGREVVDLAEASRYPTILPVAVAERWSPGESAGHRFGDEATIAVETNGCEVIKSWVEAGLGISVVPRVCLTEKDRVRKIPFPGQTGRRSYGVHTRRDEPLSTPARRFVRLLAPGFPDTA